MGLDLTLGGPAFARAWARTDRLGYLSARRHTSRARRVPDRRAHHVPRPAGVDYPIARRVHPRPAARGAGDREGVEDLDSRLARRRLRFCDGVDAARHLAVQMPVDLTASTSHDGQVSSEPAAPPASPIHAVTQSTLWL